MRSAALAAALIALGGAAVPGLSAPDRPAPPSGLVKDPRGAQVDYMLNCQGCHLADGAGRAGQVPKMTGEVARLLAAPGGRRYLASVPGVANAALSNADLADLMNWTLLAFDAEHLPDAFQPYTAEEIEAARAAPLGVRAGQVRADLLEALRKAETAASP